MSADSRRSSSSSTSASQPSTPSTGPSTPTGKSPPSFEGSSFSRYNSSTKRKLNPVRRCQSMKNPNAGNINGTSSITSLTNGISPCNSNNSSFSSIGSTPSFRSRRVSSTPSSLENGRNHTETDFVKYYQYKINRPDTSLPFTIMISNDSQETKTQFNSNGNKHSTNAKTNDTNDSTNNEHSKCRVLVLGSTSCGKTSLIRSFEDYIEQTDDSIDRDYAYYRTKYQDENRSNNPTKRSNEIKPALYLHFIEANSLHSCYPQSPLNFYQPDAYIVVYGVNSRESFEGAKKIIDEIFKWDDVDTKPIILVANKTDLVRSRIVSKQEGRQLAMMNNCKYIETSCTISHNVDFLLTGIGAQINLKINSKRCQPNGRKPNIIKRFLNKAVLKKSKSCDNLHVL